MSIEKLVRSIKVVSNRFPQNHHFYKYVSKELALRGRKVNSHNVRVIFRDPKRIPPDIATIVREAHKTIRADSGLHDDNFLPIDRSKGPQICREVNQMAIGMIDWYQFRSKGILARYISHELSVGYGLVTDLIMGVKRSIFTPEILKVHSFMRRMIDAVERAYKERHSPPTVPSYYIVRGQKSLAEIIDKSVKRLFEGEKPKVVIEAVNYINSKLKAFTATGQLTVLSKRMKESYRFPSKEGFNSFASDTAEIKKMSQIGRVRSGLKEPYSYHRKFYAVSLALDYAKKAGLDGKVRERIDQKYLPLGRAEYKQVIDEVRKATNASPRILALMLAQAFGMNPDAVRNDYLKARSNTMPHEYSVKIQGLIQNPPFFVFSIGQKGTNNDELKRFIEKYEGGNVLVNYEGTKRQFDREVFTEIIYLTVKQGGQVFFKSSSIPTESIIPVKDYKVLFPQLLTK